VQRLGTGATDDRRPLVSMACLRDVHALSIRLSGVECSLPLDPGNWARSHRLVW
jgi:hypothetical protein